MNEKDLNIEYICEKTLLAKDDELVPIILDLIKDSYKSGLCQAEFDNTMNLIEENQELKKRLDETTLILKSCVLELMDIAKLNYYWIVSNKIEKAKDKIISYKVMGNNDTKFFIDKGDSNDR